MEYDHTLKARAFFLSFLEESLEYPEAFSWRRAKPECLSPAQDQGSCGGCYAFAATSVLASRLCLQTGEMHDLSTQYILDCDFNDDGCKGGRVEDVLNFLQERGTISNLPFRGAKNQEISEEENDEICFQENKKFKCKEVKQLLSTQAIKHEIYANGPVETSMIVFEDLLDYKKGEVYLADESRRIVGGHAVTLVGYTKDTWIVQNSWGSDWGDEGFFEIAIGSSYLADQGYGGAFSCSPAMEEELSQ